MEGVGHWGLAFVSGPFFSLFHFFFFASEML